MAVTQLERKPNPKNVDLQNQIGELHDCLEATAAQVDTLTGDSAVTKANLAMVLQALGIPELTAKDLEPGATPIKVRRRVGGLSPHMAVGGLIVAVVAAVPGGQLVYKILEPAVVAFAATLHQALLTAH